jgi:hypothetical protein
VTLAAGTYAISFSAAQRANYQSSIQTFQVRIDGVAVGTYTPSTTSYTTFTTNFTVAAGVHTIAFVGLNPNGGDNTAFIDQVAITSPPPGGVVTGPRIGSRIPGNARSHWRQLEVMNLVQDLGWTDSNPTGRLRRGHWVGEIEGHSTSREGHSDKEKGK